MAGAKYDAVRRAACKLEALAMSQDGFSQRAIASQFGVSQPTVSHWLRSIVPPVQGRVAAEIRAELVCCDIFEQMDTVFGDVLAQQRLRESKAYHDICYFGEWAARIAEKVQ